MKKLTAGVRWRDLLALGSVVPLSSNPELAVILRRRACVVALTVMALMSRAGAQSVPLLSFEATGGAGPHTKQTSHTYYWQKLVPFTRLGAMIRLGPPGAVRPILLLDYATSCDFGFAALCGNPDLECPVAPDGSCRQQMLSPVGGALGAGIAGAWRRTLASIAIAEAKYAERAQFVDANVGIDIAPHVMLIADARYIMTRDVLRDRTWFYPRSLGLRIH